MKKADVHIGETYLAKVTNKVVPVKIMAENRHGGWHAINTLTKRAVRIKSAQRLRGKATGTARATAPAAPVNKRIVTLAEHEAEVHADKDTRSAAKRDTGEHGAEGPKRASGLDAAARVLAEAGEPMNCKAIVERALEKGYWKTNGRTPAATISAAVTREIAAKGDDARFRKTERGKFALAR